MAGAPERLRHAFIRASEHVGAGPHGASDQHGLPCELVVDGDEGMVRGEGTRRALAVDQEPLQLPVHHVLLLLRDVVRDVVDDVHVEVVGGAVKDLQRGLN